MTLFRFATPYFEIEPHSGEFSIKVVLSGEERYIFRRRVVTLRPGRILLVNAGEEYASIISSPTESLSIFFRQSDAQAAARSLLSGTENLLEAPDETMPMPEVAQVAFPVSSALDRYLGCTVSSIDGGDCEAADDAVRRLLPAALAEAWKITPPLALAHIRRSGTRDELVARILRARELIDESGGRELNLDRLAGEACLSRYHFLRVFSAVVGETPVAHARRLRLERASRALSRGEDPRKAARDAGYKDYRAFCRACRRLDSKPRGRQLR